MTLRPVITVSKRKRRRIVWTGATVAATAVWMLISQMQLGFDGGQFTGGLDHGALCLAWNSDRRNAERFVFTWYPANPPFSAFDSLWRVSQRPLFGSTDPSGYGYLSLPLWPLLLVMLLPMARAWFATPLLPSGCSRCGYDLSGLVPGAVCPECGAARVA